MLLTDFQSLSSISCISTSSPPLLIFVLCFDPYISFFLASLSSDWEELLDLVFFFFFFLSFPPKRIFFLSFFVRGSVPTIFLSSSESLSILLSSSNGVFLFNVYSVGLAYISGYISLIEWDSSSFAMPVRPIELSS